MNAELREELLAVRAAARKMMQLSAAVRHSALEELERRIEEHEGELLAANARDLATAQGETPEAMFQRLKLSPEKLGSVRAGIRDLAAMADPVGRVISRMELDEGLVLDKVSVPLGVVAVIFESRPDVLPQVAALAIRSGNALVLKGGREAAESNRAFMAILNSMEALPAGWVLLLEGREQIREVIREPDLVDLAIPRGSRELVLSIMRDSAVPVMGHADGVCHIYVHDSARRSPGMESSVEIVCDAKAQYPSACNAVETVLVDRTVMKEFLPRLAFRAQDLGIELRGCAECRTVLPGITPAMEADWVTEYGALILALKVVDGTEEAIEHINCYGSHHTDAILAAEVSEQELFFRGVDSACVFANCSTRFADGYRFGLGAEVGIGTGKIHARGPVGIEGLMTYKYQLHGNGQVVQDYVQGVRAFTHRVL